MNSPPRKKIWIDLENSPHVPFFRPIMQELHKRGYATTLTARDCSQTCGLADLFGLQYVRIGRHYGKNKLLKFAGLLLRALQLMPIILREKPVLALAHGSRSQLMVASLLRIPSVEIIDYEHTYTMPLFNPDWIIAPEIISPDDIPIDKKRILNYPGIKEDIYVPSFRAQGSMKDAWNIKESDLMITIRPPATEAHYFVPESQELFVSTVQFLALQKNVRLIIVPRNEKQKADIKKAWPRWFDEGKIIIPDHVVDGLNLIWYSDLVISGGGTMNREAAALGVPVYSIFRGKIGAVDRYLAETGRLILLQSPEDVRSKVNLASRQRPERPKHLNKAALERVVENLVAIADPE